MPDAASLHCPNCGAPVDPALHRCPFCKARLATVSCPSCFSLMFEGSRFCPACGGRAARSEGETTAATCPDCRLALRELRVGTAAILECGSCDCVWVDAQTFEALCADREAQAAVVHQYAGTTRPSKPVAPRESVSGSPSGEAPQRGFKYRPCVRCGMMMNRVNFARISGVVVDVCKGHGTFLDPGELHAIVSFIHAGGLERARRRQLVYLREQEKRALDAERRLARDRARSETQSHGMQHSWLFLIGHE
jgi:Zn-finger nucleic acid-binding protein